MQTFAVSDVTPATRPLEPVTLEHALRARLPPRKKLRQGRDRSRSSPPKLEAGGVNQPHLVGGLGSDEITHPLIDAVHTAFASHYPLVLSPDDVWLCLAQGFALHVELNARVLRSRFVRHEGQLQLEIQRHDFVRGSPDNDWQGCFAQWSDAIAAHIGKTRELVVASFSTTGPIERAASELVLMSAMKSYFGYSVISLCGIPAITLLGAVEDWRAIRRRAEVFAEFDVPSSSTQHQIPRRKRHRAEALAEFKLTEWVAALLPVLDQFVAAAAGNADRELWRSIYKQNGYSGGPYVTGWINVLFPYLVNRDDGKITPNRHTLRWSREMDPGDLGAKLDDFPLGMSHAPLTWDYLGTKLRLTLSGGFVGIAQDPETLAVRPAIGWAVREMARHGGGGRA